MRTRGQVMYAMECAESLGNSAEPQFLHHNLRCLSVMTSALVLWHKLGKRLQTPSSERNTIFLLGTSHFARNRPTIHQGHQCFLKENCDQRSSGLDLSRPDLSTQDPDASSHAKHAFHHISPKASDLLAQHHMADPLHCISIPYPCHTAGPAPSQCFNSSIGCSGLHSAFGSQIPGSFASNAPGKCVTGPGVPVPAPAISMCAQLMNISVLMYEPPFAMLRCSVRMRYLPGGVASGMVKFIWVMLLGFNGRGFGGEVGGS
jgi:hypothetical protein